MRRAPSRHCIVPVLVAGLLSAPALGAQSAADSLSCHRTTCRLGFEGGVNSVPSDRRYGSPTDFEARLRSGLLTHGIRVDFEGTGDLTMELRPRINTRTMCDEMPGVNTDMSCASIAEVTVTFTATDPARKVPPTQPFRNRCPNVKSSMTHSQFGLYVAEMIWYVLEGERNKAARPSIRC